MPVPSVPVLSLAQGIDADALHGALVETGFVVLTEHGIELARLQRTYDAVARFFALPGEEKARYIKGRDGQRGYTPLGRENAKGRQVPDLKEFYHIGRAAIAPNVWPEGPDGFREDTLWLYGELEHAGMRLLRALTGPLGVETAFFSRMCEGGNSVLRLLHYPPVPEGADPRAVRAGAHEDINLITLLVSASSTGLELLDREGTWRAVEAPPNAIIADAGDMLARITGGAVPATTHRVVNPKGPNVSRYSMPFFLHPRPEAALSVLPRFAGQDTAAPITAGAFLAERLAEIGLS